MIKEKYGYSLIEENNNFSIRYGSLVLVNIETKELNKAKKEFDDFIYFFDYLSS